MQRGNSGFTLIEILIVMAIISVLAGLLVPMVSKSRSLARNTICCNNLRQWGTALTMYMNDYQGYIPTRGQGVRELQQINRGGDWFNCLPPYLDQPPCSELAKEGRLPGPGDDSIFICPEARAAGGQYFLPYAMNMYLSPWILPEPHNIADIPCASQVVFLADAPGPYSSTAPSDQPYNVEARHDGKANVLFLDGHVRAFSSEYLGCGVGDPKHSDVRWDFDSYPQ